MSNERICQERKAVIEETLRKMSEQAPSEPKAKTPAPDDLSFLDPN